ncbi:MAG TPA: protein kinase, partial [Pirellulales bacterium]|nr:protein kinase [Pirellulales bacterium]
MTEPNGADHGSQSNASAEPTQALPTTEAASELVQILDRCLADLQRGQSLDRERLYADHPALAAQLEQCLAGIEFIHQAAKPASSPTVLGDFRILRELGRGGMGVVYEAEQLSLRRLVALKVLRFGAVADKEALERFRREAETVAHLHHTNIVPIFAVGAENGVSYYAMQYIEGGSLAEKIAPAAPSSDSDREPAPAAVAPAATRSETPFLEVARWGLESAEALAHAH